MRERKAIDLALRRFLDEQAAALGAPAEMTDEVRTRMLRQRMVRALESRTSIPGLPNQVVMRPVEIASGLLARLYTPPEPRVRYRCWCICMVAVGLPAPLLPMIRFAAS